MARYPGRNAVVYLSTSASTAASLVLGLNKWTVNKTTGKIDVTSFNDANKTYVQDLPDLKGTFNGVWDDTESKPFTAAGSSNGCQMYLYPSSNAPTKFWAGPAWLDVSMDVDVNGAVQISGNFAANGSWVSNF